MKILQNLPPHTSRDSYRVQGTGRCLSTKSKASPVKQARTNYNELKLEIWVKVAVKSIMNNACRWEIDSEIQKERKTFVISHARRKVTENEASSVTFSLAVSLISEDNGIIKRRKERANRHGIKVNAIRKVSLQPWLKIASPWTRKF